LVVEQDGENGGMTSIRDHLRGLRSLEGTPPAFDPSVVPADPTELFLEWFQSAVDARVAEPHAMTLSTIGLDGVPDARVLILKDVADDGWWFASSSESAKGAQLDAAPVAALTFYWPELARSVRLKGRVEPADPEQSAEDFRNRGLGARAVALASRESQPLVSRAHSEKAIAAARDRLADDPRLVSATWTLWCLLPDHVEFWQADQERQHLRIQYHRGSGNWSSTMLWP
jgi:pyridoxamine 5'-phosphate oxidase